MWWVNGDSTLPAPYLQGIQHATDGLGVSAISCWEIAKKIERESRKPPEQREMTLSLPVADWILAALKQPGVFLIPISPEISIDSASLPDIDPYKITDPGDQLIIATARIENITLMTLDSKILKYPHVPIWKPPDG